MNGRAPMGYHRRNSYKKKRLRNVIIISAVILLVLFVVFLIIGNTLFKKTNTTDDDEPKDKTSATEQKNNTAPYSIQAYNIDLTGLSSSDFSDKLSALSKNGATAVSIKCTDKEGKLLYASDIAKEFGYQNNSSSLISLGTLTSSANRRDIFTSAYMTVASVNEKDAKTRSVMIAYEAALVCEMIESGVKEVLLRCPDASPENLNDILSIANNVKLINKDATVGIEIPSKILSSELASEHIDKLATSFDFMALTMVEPSKDSETVEQVDALLTTHLFYILRYNMRVLIPSAEDEDTKEALQTLLTENSIANWQEIS